MSKVEYTYKSDNVELLTHLQNKFYADPWYASRVWVWLHKSPSECGIEVGNEFGRALSESLRDKVETDILTWVEEFES
jgi:hypothetical protein